MDPVDEYRRQFEWRRWERILDLLPDLKGQTIFDFGCGIGDLSEELTKRGARVIGIDANPEFLEAARRRNLECAEFLQRDARNLGDIPVTADGLWCSFAAAYFVNFGEVLARWRQHLKKGSWVALTEIDDLFGHSPVKPETQSLLEAYADEAMRSGRYDFRMGRKLKNCAENAGFVLKASMTLEDQELAFNGPAEPGVVEAWRTRFDRMKLLQDFCGERFRAVREDFLHCLESSDHSCSAKVCCCIALKKNEDSPTSPFAF